MSVPNWFPARRSAIWIGFGTIAAAGLSALFQGLLSVQLSEVEFGIFSSALVIAVSISMISAMGAQNVFLQLVKSNVVPAIAVLRSFTTFWLAASLTLSLSAAILLPVVPVPTHYFFLVIGLSSMLSIFSILASASQSADNFREVGLFIIAPEAAKIGAILCATLLAVENPQALALLFSIIFLTISASCFAFLFSLRKRTLPVVRMRQLILLGLPHALSALLFMVYYRTSIVIFAMIDRPAEAGSLAVIYLFMTAILLLPTAYSQRYLLGRWHQFSNSNLDDFRLEIFRQMRKLSVLIVPISFLWFLFSDNLLNFVYGQRYGDAQSYAPYFALIFLIRGFCIPLQAANSIARLRWKKTLAIFATGTVTVALTFYLGTIYGLLGGLIAALAAEITLMLGLALAALLPWKTDRLSG